MTAGDTRRRPGGARPDGPLLQRPQIVEAALALTRRHGLDGMSMRKLGDELGVTSMAIYWYFKGKDELIDAITDQVFATIEIPMDPGAPWDERLRWLSWAVHDVLVDYPGIADQIYTHQNYPASALPLLDAGMAALRDAGFDEVEAAEAFNVLASVVITRSHFEAYQRLELRRSGEPVDTVDDRVRQAWSRLAGPESEGRPGARSYIDHLDRVGAGAAIFERAIEVVLRGLRAQLDDARQTGGPSG